MRVLTSIFAFGFSLYAAEPSLAQPTLVEIDLRIGTYKGGYSRGQDAAKRHLKEGKLRLVTYGGLSVPRSEGFELALSNIYAQHGVELTPAGACTSPEDERGFIAGYNSVATPELERRFGKDFLARMEMQADAMSKRSSK